MPSPQKELFGEQGKKPKNIFCIFVDPKKGTLKYKQLYYNRLNGIH